MKTLKEALFSRRNISNLKTYHINDVIDSFDHYMIFNKVSKIAMFIDAFNMDYYELIAGPENKPCEFNDGNLDEEYLKSIIKREAKDKNAEFVKIDDLYRYGLVTEFTYDLGNFIISNTDFGKFIDKLINKHEHEFFKVEL